MKQELDQLENLLQHLTEKYQMTAQENHRLRQRVTHLEEEKRLLAASTSAALADMERTHQERLKHTQKQLGEVALRLREDNEQLLQALSLNADRLRSVMNNMLQASMKTARHPSGEGNTIGGGA